MKMLAEILVVNDDAHMRDLVVKVLTCEGYSMPALLRGQDVLEASEEVPVDLVVLDIRMPGMDGMTLLREVKRRAPETWILLMTAFGSIDGSVANFDFRGKIRKPGISNSMTYSHQNSRKSKIATEPIIGYVGAISQRKGGTYK